MFTHISGGRSERILDALTVDAISLAAVKQTELGRVGRFALEALRAPDSMLMETAGRIVPAMDRMSAVMTRAVPAASLAREHERAAQTGDLEAWTDGPFPFPAGFRSAAAAHEIPELVGLLNPRPSPSRPLFDNMAPAKALLVALCWSGHAGEVVDAMRLRPANARSRAALEENLQEAANILLRDKRHTDWIRACADALARVGFDVPDATANFRLVDNVLFAGSATLPLSGRQPEFVRMLLDHPEGQTIEDLESRGFSKPASTVNRLNEALTRHGFPARISHTSQGYLLAKR